MITVFEDSQDEKIQGLKIILREAKRFSDNKKIYLPDDTTNHIKNLDRIAQAIKLYCKEQGDEDGQGPIQILQKALIFDENQPSKPLNEAFQDCITSLLQKVEGNLQRSEVFLNLAKLFAIVQEHFKYFRDENFLYDIVKGLDGKEIIYSFLTAKLNAIRSREMFESQIYTLKALPCFMYILKLLKPDKPESYFVGCHDILRSMQQLYLQVQAFSVDEESKSGENQQTERLIIDTTHKTVQLRMVWLENLPQIFDYAVRELSDEHSV